MGEPAVATVPHLAIEIALRPSAIDELDIYAALGVREVWFWRNGTFEIFVRRGRRYARASASVVLRGIDHALVARYAETKPMTRAVREFRRAQRR